MRVFTLIVLVFLLLGCSDKNSSQELDTNPQYDEYLWHLFFTENDFSISYAIDKDAHINIQQAWEITKGAGVKVAIIDESFEATHEDIVENVILTYNAGNDTQDVSGYIPSHGTTCSGHVGALDNEVGIIGSAPEVELILIKYGYTDLSIIKAFDKALSEGAQVISCSWGTYDVSQAIADKLQEVYSRGVTVVFAVGNDDKSLDDENINDESESPYVLGIGASCEDNDVCAYSNYGKNIDFLAPGGDYYNSIGVLGLDDTNSSGRDTQKNLVNENYTFHSGTSYSAPLVAGVIALMYSIKPDITPVEVRDILMQSSQKIGDGIAYDSDGFEIKRGYGKIDAYEALKITQALQ